MRRSVIAFIGARKGPERVPEKNTKMVSGKPLICYTIERALTSNLFEVIYINTDDENVVDIAQNYKDSRIVPYVRPTSLGRSDVFIIDVVKEMLIRLNIEESTTVGIMFPTVPLRDISDIWSAKKLFDEHGKSVVSCTKLDYPVHLAQRAEGNGLSPAFPQYYQKSTRHNDHEVLYRANFAIIFNSAGTLKRQDNLIGDRPVPYFMPPERSIDIDEPYQKTLVELLLKGRKI